MCKPCIITAILFLLIVTGAFFYLWDEAHAAESGEVIINEILISPTGERFIELYNTTDATIDLTGWYVQRKTATGSTWSSFITSTNFEGTSILASRYFLIARADSTAASNADIIIDGSMTMTADNSLRLRSPEFETISLLGYGDAAEYEDGPAPAPQENKSLARKSNTGNNETDFEIQNPTPGTANSSPAPEPEPEPQEEPEPTLEPEPEPAPEPEETQEEEQPETEEPSEPQFTKTKDIIISEFIPNPEGSDSENEWIELYNTGENIIDISGWFLDDIEGGSKPFIFPDGTTILPNEYRVFSIKLTKISLHNTQPDAVRILYPDNSIADEVEYFEKADEGVSYALVAENWIWTDNSTPGYANQGPSPKQETGSSEQERIKTTKTAPVNNTNNDSSSDEDSYADTKTLTTEEFSAQIGGNDTEGGNFLPVILGILIAMIGGIGFLILYKKISQ